MNEGFYPNAPRTDRLYMCVAFLRKVFSHFWFRRDTTMWIFKFIDEKYGGHAVTRVIKILLFGPPIYVCLYT